MNFGPQTEKL